MEKSFILDADARYAADMVDYLSFRKQQCGFVKAFSEKYGIEANQYLIGGTGSINVPFSERFKKEIHFSIVPTENDLEKFALQLKVPKSEYGLRTFKLNSEIGKLFAQACVDEQVVINIHKPMLCDTFKSIGLSAAKYSFFTHNGKHYLCVSSEALKDDDVPPGCHPIKTSEFHIALEEFEGHQEKKAS